MKKKIEIGDMFTIPLYLPDYQEWTDLEDLRDYKSYTFREDDPYAFGRLIDVDMGNCKLVEVFRYVGKIPPNPQVLIDSGRMFRPIWIVHVFERSRWRFLFDNPQYDKWADSDYENISFLLHTDLWKCGKSIPITMQQREEYAKSGVLPAIIHGGVSIERDIRAWLTQQGMELNYGQTVEARRTEYPQPRDIDKKLKETIAPFRWLSERNRYSLYLEAGRLNQDCFDRNGLSGNGYDWEKAARAFIETKRPAENARFSFDCEADTFSMQSIKKKPLKEFALAFHQFVMDTKAFEELLRML
ncbi:MAG: hypothetical protein HFI75_02110 [Lachnospiraceae bacterium]|nr:hypothetical protein [Lachnospiraceae bacterium]